MKKLFTVLTLCVLTNFVQAQCPAPTGLQVTCATTFDATLKCDAQTGVSYYAFKIGNGYRISSTPTAYFPELLPNTSYTVSLTTLCNTTAINESNQWETITFTTPTGTATSCNAPTNLNAAYDGYAVGLSWDRVCECSGYTIQYRRNGGKWQTETRPQNVFIMNGTKYTQQGTNYLRIVKPKSGSYEFKVKANCSDYSTSHSFNVP